VQKRLPGFATAKAKNTKAPTVTVICADLYRADYKRGIGMRKRSGTVSEGEVQPPKEQTRLPDIKSWQPSRMETGLRNRPIGKKVSVSKSAQKGT
jgi:hypothetical protein